jgi:dCMP deaminase
MPATLIAYVPVIHCGYLELFKKSRADRLFLLGTEMLSLLPRLSRDMRALSPEHAQDLLQKGAFFPEGVHILTPDTVSAVRGRLVMPDEDISHLVAKKYFPRRTVRFERIFLRWDMPQALSQQPVHADQKVQLSDLVRQMGRLAQQESQKSSDWWRQVGAVAFRGEEVLAFAHNRHLPTEHSPYINGDPRSNCNAGEHPDIYTAIHAEAEIIVKMAAEKGATLRGASVFVTTFPCRNCADMLAAGTGIRQVFFIEGYSKLDAQEILRGAGIKIIHVDIQNPRHA